MQFSEAFVLPCAPARLWELLLDVRQVAQCLQGVEDLVLVDDDTFQGTLRVKMGPASFAFGGEVRVVRRDRETFTATLSAQALDRGAGGGFKCELTMRILQETAALAAQGELPRNQGGLPRNQAPTTTPS